MVWQPIRTAAEVEQQQRDAQLTQEQQARLAAEQQEMAQDAAWARIQAQEAAEEKRWQRESERADQLLYGRQLLGLAQNRDGVWLPRHADRTRGLPAAPVEAARRAVEAERAALGALTHAHNDALAYCQKHGLSAEAARVKLELARAEPWTAFQEATKAADRACLALGTVARQIETLRAELAKLPAEQKAADHAHYQAQAQREQRIRAVRAELAALGLVE